MSASEIQILLVAAIAVCLKFFNDKGEHSKEFAIKMLIVLLAMTIVVIGKVFP